MVCTDVFITCFNCPASKSPRQLVSVFPDRAPVCWGCVSSEEYSDDGQTDYEEEDAAGSALSDYEMSYLASELTEEEETADTAETVPLNQSGDRVTLKPRPFLVFFPLSLWIKRMTE